MDTQRTAPELTAAEKSLLAELEPEIREAVWSTNLKSGQFSQPGKWIPRALSLPTKTNALGKPMKVTLTPQSSSEDFLESCCINRGEHWHTAVAVYRILRTLKKRGLLNVQGFECGDVRPPSKNRD